MQGKHHDLHAEFAGVTPAFISFGRYPGMSDRQKEKIFHLRRCGFGYAKIAAAVGLSENTVKSHCRRNGLGGAGAVSNILAGTPCRNCGKPLEQQHGRKKRVFCSDACRTEWWNAHPDMVDKKAVYRFTCPVCGTGFESYGNKGRIYCSRSCYIAGRSAKGRAI